jgi:hypothetical protein
MFGGNLILTRFADYATVVANPAARPPRVAALGRMHCKELPVCSETLEALLASVASVPWGPGVVGFVISSIRIGVESVRFSVYLYREDGTHEEITR